MKILAIAWAFLFAIDTPTLTPAQQLTFQTTQTAYYFAVANASLTSAAFESVLTDEAKRLRTELTSRQQEVLRLQKLLKAACPGDLVDDLEGKKPAECRPKPPDTLKGDKQ